MEPLLHLCSSINTTLALLALHCLSVIAESLDTHDMIVDNSERNTLTRIMALINSREEQVSSAFMFLDLFLFRIFSHFYVGSMFLYMRRLHLTRSCASSPDSSLCQVVPDVIQPPPLLSSSPSFPRYLHHHHSLAHRYSTSFLNTCPNHFKLLSWTFF